MKKALLAWILVFPGILLPVLLPLWWLSAFWTVAVLTLCNVGIKKSILIGVISFGLVWMIASLYWLWIDETGMMGRTSAVLGGISSTAFLFVTFLVGIITGALSGWLGGALGQLKNKNTAQQNG